MAITTTFTVVVEFFVLFLAFSLTVIFETVWIDAMHNN